MRTRPRRQPGLPTGVARATSILFLLAASHASGATFVVNDTADAIDANPGDGACASPTGTCTLRAAILEANALAGGDEITLPPGVYALAIPGTGENAGLMGDLDVRDDLTISGAGARLSVVDGAALDRVFDFRGNFTLSGLTIRGGLAPVAAGAVYGGVGDLSMTACEVTLNSAVSGPGGVVATVGNVVLTDCEVFANASESEGAVSIDQCPQFTMTRCTVRDNDGDGLLLGQVDQASIVDSEVFANTGRGVWVDRSSVVIERCTIRDQPEGVVLNRSTLLVSDSRIERCTSPNDGGGIAASITPATIDIRRTTFDSNTSGRDGGAIAGPYFANGSGPALRLTDCTFLDNRAVRGGAVSVRGDAFTASEAAWMTNSTFVDNVADTDGGAIHMIARAGAVKIENCTITGNSGARGAGIFTDTGSTASVHDSIVAGNVGPGSDCAGAIASGGYNLFGDMSGATLTGATASDLVGVDPLMGPLQDNGGPVPTSAPLLASRAIEGGDPAGCLDSEGLPLLADARGFVRPVDFDEDGLARCDVGALEVACGPDGDGDGLGDDCDCLPLDSGVRTVPDEVALLVARSALGEALLSWTDRSADAGSSTTYDVASAELSALAIARVANGPCLVVGLVTPGWSDARAISNDGFYYLVRAANACGPALGDGWGNDSSGIPRPACP